MSWDPERESATEAWTPELSDEQLANASIVKGNDVELADGSAADSPNSSPLLESFSPADLPAPPEPPSDPTDPRALAEYQRRVAEYNQLMSTMSNLQQNRHETVKDIARNIRG